MNRCLDCGRPPGAPCCVDQPDPVRPAQAPTRMWGLCPCAACFAWRILDTPTSRCAACTEAGCESTERHCRVLLERDRAARRAEVGVAGPGVNPNPDRLDRALGAILDSERDTVAAVIEDAILWGTGVVQRIDGELRRIDPADVVVCVADGART